MTATQTKAVHASLGFLLLIGALSAFPPVTTDIYLPALPALTRALHGATAEGQHTLSAYFLGLGAGQLFYGPWSDRVGRRPTMLIGAAVYLVATLGCALSTSVDQMIVLRFFQAVGACSGVVISAAIVRDRYEHQESARIYSILLTIRGVGPILAPIAGGLIVTFLGWRAIFWALTGFGAAIGLVVLLGMKESRTAAVAERARSESPLRAYRAALGDRRIVGYMLTSGLNFGGMFAWIAAAPYLVIGTFHVPTLWFGWIFGINAAGFMAASQINHRLLHHHAADTIMRWGAVGAAVAAAILLTCALTGFGGAFGVMIPLFFTVASLGFVSTNAMAGGLAVDPSRAGTVSALFGATQFALGGAATAVAAAFASPPAIGMAAIIAVFAAGALVFPLFGVKPAPRRDPYSLG